MSRAIPNVLSTPRFLANAVSIGLHQILRTNQINKPYRLYRNSEPGGKQYIYASSVICINFNEECFDADFLRSLPRKIVPPIHLHRPKAALRLMQNCLMLMHQRCSIHDSGQKNYLVIHHVAVVFSLQNISAPHLFVRLRSDKPNIMINRTRTRSSELKGVRFQI